MTALLLRGAERRALWTLALALIVLTVGAGAAHAVDAVTGASRRSQPPGATVAIWITGRGFSDTVTVEITGGGLAPDPERPIRFIAQADRIDGGLGDGLIYGFVIDVDAPPGPRDLVVSDVDGTQKRLVGGIVIEGEVVAPDPDAGVVIEDASLPPPDAAGVGGDGGRRLDGGLGDSGGVPDGGFAPQPDLGGADGADPGAEPPQVNKDRAVLRGVSSCTQALGVPSGPTGWLALCLACLGLIAARRRARR